MMGCTTTMITSSWKPVTFEPAAAKKILVLGVIRSSDHSVKQTMERHLTEDLKDMGYQAVSSWDVYGPKAFESLTEQQALESIREKGYDAVLTIVLLDKDRERSYYPSTFYFSPFVYYYNNFWGYHAMMMNRIYQPGYYITSTRHFWESNLYEMNTQQLVYSVQTRSFDPASTESMAHEHGELIANEIGKKGLIRK